ncbi:DHA2 family efflux MFS transporter permease subunit [Marinobacterium lutimaris]|uniref:MFS transporter, DHA2 family, multidrug resistance protein n=1 Tax=Marinobacterium lutimaris TaxID=568106 RepID=A0A1H6DI85_9GAMM|nr:DHA2 family efflux MFS transporter permease subunit [Marinobacterium lutimaris]SEG84922.1 MFS transporter, DHA2 family, multidrug resistance protein [Marinobacterium lutimaris]
MSEAAQFTPKSRVLATIALALGTFMQVLDTTIANVALPSIAGNLGASSEQGTWVITSFAVANAIALPITGWMARRIGEVRLYMLAVVLFMASSLLCGIASSMPELVAFRALQGFVAGPLYPITQTLLIAIYPPARRGMALALLAMVAVVAPITGPIAGGWLTDNFSWPWIFFINLPIGAFAAAVVWNQMKDRPEQTVRQPIDYVGLGLLVLGVGTLQVVLDKGNDLDWFESSFILYGAAIAVVSLIALVIWELTEEHPVINLRLFRYRNFTFGTLALVLAFAAFFSINLLLPVWLQTRLDYTPIWAGLAAAPIGLIPLFLSPIVGRFGHHVDMRMLATIAFMTMGATCFLRAGFNIFVDFEHVALVQLAMGLGVALFFMPATTILLSSLAPNEIADGSGLATFLRVLGGSFASSLTTWWWHREASVQHALLTEHVTAYSQQTREYLNLLGGDSVQNYARINEVITSQAFMISFTEIMTLLGWIFLALITVIWITKPPFFGRKAEAKA